MDVGRETVQVVLKISEKLLLAAPRLEIAQRELGRVVEGLPRSGAKRSPLLGAASSIALVSSTCFFVAVTFRKGVTP